MADENEKDPKKPVDGKDGEGKTTPPKKDGKGKEELEDDKMSENFLKLFDGLELSEDFKTRAAVIFTAAVNEQADAKSEKVISEKVAELEEAATTEREKLSEEVDRYLTHAVRVYMDENKLAIESGIKVEAASAVMESAREICEQVGVDIPDSELDAVSEAEQKLAESQEKLNNEIRKTVELQESINALTKEKVLGAVSEGLILTDIERLNNLAESVTFEDESQFTAAVTTLRESFIKGEPVSKPEPKLNEGKMVNVDGVNLDEGVEAPQPKKRRF